MKYSICALADPPSRSVVAVHGIEGLNKDARECWTSEPAEYQEECSWLLDILPREITGVRVMSFTYGNDTDNGAHAFTAEGVRKNARDLLDCLRSERQDEKVCSEIRPGSAFDNIPY